MSSRSPGIVSASGGCGGCAAISGCGRPRRRRAGVAARADQAPLFDDLVQRQFRAERPDAVWLTDITEHPTGEGKLYCCAIKDVFSNRIVGYSIDDRMTAQLAVSALRSAVARRQPSGTVVVHSDRGSASSAHERSGRSWALRGSPGRWAGSPPRGTTRRWNRSSRCCRRTCWTSTAGRPARSSATRSSPGSNTPTTTGAANERSAGSPRSSSNSPSPTRRSRGMISQNHRQLNLQQTLPRQGMIPRRRARVWRITLSSRIPRGQRGISHLQHWTCLSP